MNATLLERVTDPLLQEQGVALHVLRLDRIDALAPGNKLFKLEPNLERARSLGYDRVLSFGGAWSNHIHALAAAGAQAGMQTVGVIRGERPARLSPTLQDARRWGMELVFVSRSAYRQRQRPEFLERLLRQVGEAYVIPEGGANRAGVEGCRRIVALIEAGLGEHYDTVAVACGTGATLAGIAAGLPPDKQALGIAVLKGAAFLERDVHGFLREIGAAAVENWRVDHRFHGGGYAKMNDDLAEFMIGFSDSTGIPIEPVYTGKLFYGLYYSIAQGAFSRGTRLVAVHTGGLQGLRGMQARLGSGKNEE